MKILGSRQYKPSFGCSGSKPSMLSQFAIAFLPRERAVSGKISNSKQ